MIGLQKKNQDFKLHMNNVFDCNCKVDHSATSLQVPAVQELHTEDMVQWGQRQEECGSLVE